MRKNEKKHFFEKKKKISKNIGYTTQIYVKQNVILITQYIQLKCVLLVINLFS